MEPLSKEENILILRYIDNDMTPEERSEFEAALETNKALQGGLAFEKSLLDIGETEGNIIKSFLEIEDNKGYEETKTLLQEAKEIWEKENKEPPEKFTSASSASTEADERKPGKMAGTSIWKRLTVAAAILVIITLGVIFYMRYINQDSWVAAADKTKLNALFASSFQPDDVPENQPESLKQALEEYKNGNYKEAIEAMDNKVVDTNVVVRGPEDKELTGYYEHYYKAMSYIMADSNFVHAVPELENAATKGPDQYLKSKAQWYLALAYLKTNELKKTDALLKQISKNDQAGVYKQKAIDLLNKLRSTD